MITTTPASANPIPIQYGAAPYNTATLCTQESCIPHYLNRRSWGWAIFSPPMLLSRPVHPPSWCLPFRPCITPYNGAAITTTTPPSFITTGNVVAMFIPSSNTGILHKGPLILPCSLFHIPPGEYCLLPPHELTYRCSWLHPHWQHYSHPCLSFHHPAMGMTMAGFFYLKKYHFTLQGSNILLYLTE